jgi:hypothetical protein
VLDVYVIQSDALLVTRPNGILDFKAASEMVAFVEIKELRAETGFNRFCDLTRLEGIHLTVAEVLQLADRRRRFNPNNVCVKSAFLATNPLAFGIARMYEQLLFSPRINVRVLDDIQVAADWLGVKLDSLML